MASLGNIFRHDGKIDRLLVGIFFIINGLVLVNALLHEPAIGYDTTDHFANIRVLANGHLPTSNESSEFFSPPLPYLLPAGLLASGIFTIETAAKVGQLINVLCSFGLTLLVLFLCQHTLPDDRKFKLYALALTGFLPVYYKSFVMIRGEPYLAFWAVFSLYFALRAFSNISRMVDAAVLGLGIGFAILSRQWGFFLFLSIVLFSLFRMMRNSKNLVLYARHLLVATLVAFAISGWFYIYLFNTYGTAMAFNREPAKKFSLFNQQRTFYIGTGSGKLFSDPVRSSFRNQFFPIFYTEMWGDYWAYFTIFGMNPSSGNLVEGRNLETAIENNTIPNLITNRQTFNAYLGRVNMVSLLPTMFLICCFIMTVVNTFRQLCNPHISQTSESNLLLLFFVLISIAGYGWFLIRYPDFNRGNTIKATYLLQVFPLLAILIAQPMVSLVRRWKNFYPVSLIVLSVVFIHNLPVMVTRYVR